MDDWCLHLRNKYVAMRMSLSPYKDKGLEMKINLNKMYSKWDVKCFICLLFHLRCCAADVQTGSRNQQQTCFLPHQYTSILNTKLWQLTTKRIRKTNGNRKSQIKYRFLIEKFFCMQPDINFPINVKYVCLYCTKKLVFVKTQVIQKFFIKFIKYVNKKKKKKWD